MTPRLHIANIALTANCAKSWHRTCVKLVILQVRMPKFTLQCWRLSKPKSWVYLNWPKGKGGRTNSVASIAFGFSCAQRSTFRQGHWPMWTLNWCIRMRGVMRRTIRPLRCNSAAAKIGKVVFTLFTLTHDSLSEKPIKSGYFCHLMSWRPQRWMSFVFEFQKFDLHAVDGRLNAASAHKKISSKISLQT